MTLHNGLKAGGIGAIIAIVLALLGMIPLVGCCTFIITWLVWIGVGYLAGHYGIQQNAALTSGETAKAGAIAGLITAAAGGLVNLIINGSQILSGRAATALSNLPPEVLRQLRDSGIQPEMFQAGGAARIVALLISLLCLCVIGPLLAAALGALGGALSPNLSRRSS
jgi:hypothetical protein